MRTAPLLGGLAWLILVGSALADDPAKLKPKTPLQKESLALQAEWERPPEKGADEKIIPGLRLELRERQFTILVYEKAEAPLKGRHILLGAHLAVKEVGEKRFLVDAQAEEPLFSYSLDGDRLTVTPEKYVMKRLGKEWKLADEYLLMKDKD